MKIDLLPCVSRFELFLVSIFFPSVYEMLFLRQEEAKRFYSLYVGLLKMLK